MNRYTLFPARRQQNGVAIITAILVIALGTITMVAITTSQQLDMQRERNEGIIQQARAFGISGERFAAVLLFRDVADEERKNSDSLEDNWALTIPPVPIDNASIQGCIFDMQGRFNLNNLIDEAGDGEYDGAYGIQFRKLLKQLNIEETKAAAVIDWIDKDIDFTGAEGAEDDYYSGLEVGYRTANSQFTSVSELQLVKGFRSDVEEEAEDYKLLLPHIAALPKGEDGKTTLVNVNTATPEVLASMLSDAAKGEAATLSRWESLVYEDYPECENIFDLDAPDSAAGSEPRDVDPWQDPQEFVELLKPEDENDPKLLFDVAVKSNYFQVRIDVEAEGIQLSQYTLLHRDPEGKTKVLYRSRDTL